MRLGGDQDDRLVVAFELRLDRARELLVEALEVELALVAAAVVAVEHRRSGTGQCSPHA